MYEYFGKGIVTKDNSEGKSEIEVSPVEIIRDLKGPITAMTKKFSNKIRSGDDGVSGVETEADYVIPADWFPLNTDRVTPPYVVAGEEVIILTIPNTDIYFWVAAGDKHLRKPEIVETIYSNTEKAMEKLTKETGIVFKVNSIDKKLSITTPMNRKEPATWDINLDYGIGKIKVETSNEDLISLDTVKRHIQTVSTTVEIDAKDTTITGNLLVKKNTVLEGTLTVFKSTTLKDALTVFKSVTGKAGAKFNGALKALKLSQKIPKKEHGKDHLH